MDSGFFLAQLSRAVDINIISKRVEKDDAGMIYGDVNAGIFASTEWRLQKSKQRINQLD